MADNLVKVMLLDSGGKGQAHALSLHRGQGSAQGDDTEPRPACSPPPPPARSCPPLSLLSLHGRGCAQSGSQEPEVLLQTRWRWALPICDIMVLTVWFPLGSVNTYGGREVGTCPSSPFTGVIPKTSLSILSPSKAPNTLMPT